MSCFYHVDHFPPIPMEFVTPVFNVEWLYPGAETSAEKTIRIVHAPSDFKKTRLCYDLFKAFGGIDSTLLIWTLGIVSLILIVVYRSPVLWIFPLMSALIAESVAGAVIYVLAKKDILTLDGQSQGILSEVKRTLAEKHVLPQVWPYGDGTAAKKIVEILEHASLG